ncbi:MAG: metallophosphoesterase family protein [bacterium]|nr:metallophosphoesterase family protein [bacterium]
MKIGIISDTHNNIDLTRQAIAVFKEQEVSFVIHAGDLTSPLMLKEFREFDCKFVLGNGDIDVENLNKESQMLGFGSIEEFCTFEIDNKKFIVFHGNNVPMFREAVASGIYNYIIKGHTHFFENYLSNNIRVINPGSLFGTDELSIVILDTETDKVEMIRIEED